MHNRLANTEFYEQSIKWNFSSGIRRRSWVQGLLPGDIVQLIPKATYIAWVNIVKHCRIRIEYEAKDANAGVAAQKPSNSAHYSAPLDAGSHEIRIIVVEPGEFDDPVKGYFKTVSLADETRVPSFAALSYCWGDQNDQVDIDLGSSQGTITAPMATARFSVGRTVEAALRRLRHKDTPLEVWIDAVCINQDDRKERAEQVNLMSDIFSSASAVHIWLGENNTGVETCLRLIRDLFNYSHRTCPGGCECRCSGTAHSLNLEYTDEEIKKNNLVSFRAIFEVFELAQRSYSAEAIDLAGGRNSTQISVLMTALYRSPWFSRVWVVQEALLSHRAFVRCSGELVPWEELVEVNDWLESNEFTTQQPHITSQTVMAPIWKTLRQTNQTPRNRAIAQSPHPQNDLPDILDVFLGGLDLKATDPRDKLFALYPFGKKTRVPRGLDDLAKPNYIKPVRHVFADFTRWWIKTHRSLAILSSVHCQPTRTWQKTLGPDQGMHPFERPSWALSDEGRSRWASATLATQFNFHATDGQADPLDSSDPYILRLSGYHVSTVLAIGHAPIEKIYPYSEEKDRRRHISAVFEKMFDPCAFTGFWGVRGRGGEGTAREASVDYMDHLRAHWGYFNRPDLRALLPSPEGQPEWYETNKLPTCLNRCFFVGSNKRYGLCPWAAEEGDIVVLLQGGAVPYLLRPANEKDTFKFVGECFVDGIMFGGYFERVEDMAEQKIFDII